MDTGRAWSKAVGASGQLGILAIDLVEEAHNVEEDSASHRPAREYPYKREYVTFIHVEQQPLSEVA